MSVATQTMPAPVRTHPIELHQVAPKLNTKKDQFLEDLMRDGYAIVRNVVSPEEAAKAVDEAHKWLEGFNKGYKRDDPSTWHVDQLPKHGKGGLYSLYSIGHAQFVWDLKSAPRYVEAFERIWGTDKLAVSFDGAYLGVPLPKEEIEDEGRPWPHTDQSPYRPGFYCIQSLVNLLPNKTEDGGLMVMKGSSAFWEEFVTTFKATEKDCPTDDHYRFTDEHEAWFASKGCEWVHPDLNPGDAVFWDSRTAHYGAAPSAGRPRMAVYTCYKPADQLSEAQLKKKQEAFEKGYVTSHDPITFEWKSSSTSPENITFPYGRPKLSEKALKAAGMIPY